MKKVIAVALLLMTMSAYSFGADENIKEPNVAGKFYSADPQELSGLIETFLNESAVTPSPENIPLVISPHAGYMYSGMVAANSFKAVSKSQYKTIVVIGPSHFVRFDGVSVWDKGGFKTPLGTIPIDEEFAQKLMAFNERFHFDPAGFSREHSVEVELPFLQKVFKDFKIVPIVMGSPSLEDCKNLAAGLNQTIGDRKDVLIVISSDMSHYHPDDFARLMDQSTLEAIKAMNPEFLWNQCLLRKMELCGFQPVTTALYYAQLRGLTDVEILKYGNSGDVTGDKSTVVGYGSVVFRKGKASTFSTEQKKRLLKIARDTVQAVVSTGKIPEVTETDPRLSEQEGAFVTIHNQGRLRGCIGNIIGQQPLYLTIRDMAAAAATKDTRFHPVSADELKDIDLEISVLSKPQVITDVDQIQLGVHGVIVAGDDFHRGIFLPQVATETGWGRDEFLNQLCAQKAGLPPDCWKDPQTTIAIFTADVFSEKELKD